MQIQQTADNIFQTKVENIHQAADQRIAKLYDIVQALSISFAAISAAFAAFGLVGLFVGWLSLRKKFNEIRVMIATLDDRVIESVKKEQSLRIQRAIDGLRSDSQAKYQGAISLLRAAGEEEFGNNEKDQLVDAIFKARQGQALTDILNVLITWKNYTIFPVVQRLMGSKFFENRFQILSMTLPSLAEESIDETLQMLIELSKRMDGSNMWSLVTTAYDGLHLSPSAVYSLFNSGPLMSSLAEDQKEVLRRMATGYKNSGGGSTGNTRLSIDSLNQTLLFTGTRKSKIVTIEDLQTSSSTMIN